MKGLGGGDDGNEELFGVSSVLAKAAQLKGQADAELQQLINEMQISLTDSGEIATAQRETIKAGLQALDTAEGMRAFAAHRAKIGSSVSVPNIERALCQDCDGIANAYGKC